MAELSFADPDYPTDQLLPGILEPTYWSAPDYDFTLGPEVAELSAAAGFTPDAAQQLLLDATFGFRSGNGGLRLAAFEVAAIAARQNLKTGFFKQTALGWLFITHEPLIVWSAQELSTAKEAHKDLCDLFEANDWLSRRILKSISSPAETAIYLRTGQRLIFQARTNEGGRGKSGPKMIWDEAYALDGPHVGTLMPIVSTFPLAQVLYGSSAGKRRSSVLRAVRDRGRAGGDPTMVYGEWCDPADGECQLGDACTHRYGVPGCRADNPDRLRRANPQAGRRIGWDYLRSERRSLGTSDPVEYVRERFGWWDDPPQEAARAFAGDTWTSLEDVASRILDEVPVFGVDIAPDRSSAAIVAVGLNDRDLVHVETTGQELESGDYVYDHRKGVDWILTRIRQLAGKWRGMTLVMLATAANQAIGRRLINVPGLTVVYVPDAQYGPACGALYDLVHDHGLTHVGDPELATAAPIVARRENEKGFVWGRTTSGGDITPIVAATVAAWHLAGGTDYDVLDSIADPDLDLDDLEDGIG